ncbi:MAG: GNAT family N-acetyltransferase [Coleofasciculus sp. D1-CHI-01]|uniref:GNAT family N-acetyltransferase n=1 Tax=Coleofasciculus sp. D1-CHI-01 TaxID=3068482 RepID=UPI0032FC6320
MSPTNTITQPKPTYQTFDPDINKHITFRPLILDQDLSFLHNWMNQPHVIPFWNLALTLDQMRNHLEKTLADTHQTLYIGCLDGVPMSYWESYWASEDRIAQYYSAHPTDQGIHLLIGEPDYLGKGYALPLLRAMTTFQFQHPDTKKIITEPDSRNAKMIHIFKRCSFKPQTNIQLPEKQATLMFCHRQTFFNR